MQSSNFSRSVVETAGMTENVIEKFYQEKTKELVRICRIILYRLMLTDVDAEDIVQKIAVKAWEKRTKLAHHENRMGWFIIACEKECYALARKKETQRRKFGWRIPLSEEMQNDAQQDAILRWLNQIEAKEILAELVNQMTPLEQSVYDQYYVQDRTAHETAALLGMKVNTVNDAARRIRKKALRISRRLLECFLLAWFL